MALRKKHVRRLVFALLFLFVLGPLAGLAFWGLWLRSGGLDARLERELASRLRCRALVRGAHPTGLHTAAADQVELLWRSGEGHLFVTLEDLQAEAGALGWYVRAVRGSVALSGPDPAATLAALNQRLVQSEAPQDAGQAPVLVSLVVERLSADLDAGLARISGEAAAVALGDGRVLRLTFLPADTLSAESVLRRNDTLVAPAWKADLALEPASDRGVFGGLKIEAEGVPATEIRQLLSGANADANAASGSFAIAVAWRRPETDPQAATVRVRGKGLDLADWTADLAGGPVTGRAALEVEYHQAGDEAGRLEWRLESEGGGQISAEALRHLEASVPGGRGLGDLFTGRIGYERLGVHFRGAAGGRGALAEGEEQPLVTTTLFGEEVPLLWAEPETFDGAAAWRRVWSAEGADESP